MLLRRIKEKRSKIFFLANKRVLVFQIKLRAQNYWNYSFLSSYPNNFAIQIQTTQNRQLKLYRNAIGLV